VGPACLAPRIDVGHEIARGPLRAHDILPGELLDRPADSVRPIAEPFPGVDGSVDVPTDEDEAVRETGGSIVRRFGGATEPDRDGVCGSGHERSSIDPVEPAGEVDDGFCEQPTQQSDLFLSGISWRNMNELLGKPCSRTSAGACSGPASL
jgi:hypothetical protein